MPIPASPTCASCDFPLGHPALCARNTCGPTWSAIGLARYWLSREEGSLPDAFTAHYGDGGLCGVLIEDRTGVPFTFTAHSLGAQKMDKLNVTPSTLTAGMWSSTSPGLWPSA